MRALKPILPYNNHLKPLVTTQAHEGIETHLPTQLEYFDRRNNSSP